jgi:hypothetical protein
MGHRGESTGRGLTLAKGPGRRDKDVICSPDHSITSVSMPSRGRRKGGNAPFLYRIDPSRVAVKLPVARTLFAGFPRGAIARERVEWVRQDAPSWYSRGE